MSETELTNLAREYLNLRREKFKRQGELKAIEEQLSEVEQSMVTIMDAQEWTKFEQAGNLLYKSVTPYPKERPGMDQALYTWLDEHNEGAIAKRSIHFKTLRKWYRENVSGTDKVPPSHPEWEEPLIEYLETFEDIGINVRGDDQDTQRAAAYEEYKAELNGKATE